MAAKVLTTGSTVKCPHGGAITFTSAALLRVGGQQVVRADSLSAAVVACPVTQDKCATINAASTSKSTLLRDGGSAVVLVTAVHTNSVTNGGKCSVVPGHDLLQTD